MANLLVQALGYEIDFQNADAIGTALVSDEPDPDIGVLKKPRLVSKVCLPRFGVCTPEERKLTFYVPRFRSPKSSLRGCTLILVKDS